MKSAFTKKSNKKSVQKITLGICAMDKKAQSKPMKEILSRLPHDLFEVVYYGDNCILNEPIENWPVVDGVIAFYSHGYPLNKVIEYVKLRKIFTVNDLVLQKYLLDRRRVYEILVANGIDVPRHVYLERDNPSIENIVEEYDEYVVINGVQLNKPIVEKPVDADDHNIYIYYPMSAGGGSKRLFRKVKDRSSEFYPSVNDLRTEGSYIYEEFLITQGTDVKVYTVGPDYGHAEARKSPVVDGRVNRDKSGLEVRYPVILSQQEKDIARKITLAFKQTVCGFDLLRVNNKSYVCDVNGWSFVKNSKKYYDDCAQILTEYFLTFLRPDYHTVLSTVKPLKKAPQKNVRMVESPSFVSVGDVSLTSVSEDADDIEKKNEVEVLTTEEDSNPSTEELLCVIAVIRHGDRTPKQKIKIKSSNSRVLEFFHSNVPTCRSNLKVKSQKALLLFLNITNDIISELESCGSPDIEMQSKWVHIRDVLVRDEISGIYRKLQMKPQKWEEKLVPGDETANVNPCTVEVASEIELILKWGGSLTPLGIQQSETLGKLFRHEMYPDQSGGGVLRLHSTFRHDLKIKSSDEGRVMMTAASFAKGLLELEGQLTPLLASLVIVEEKSTQMLDHYDNSEIKVETDQCKAKMSSILQVDEILTEARIQSLSPETIQSLVKPMLKLGNPYLALMRMYELLGQICAQIEVLCEKSRTHETLVAGLYLSETFVLMNERWQKLHSSFFNSKKGKFDLTKVPELYDMCRHDTLHNSHLALEGMNELYYLSRDFAYCVIPQEYGIDSTEKRLIGSHMCGQLLQKLRRDLTVAQSNTQMDMTYLLDHSHADELQIKSLGRCVRTRLYFTSESHLVSLINVLNNPLPGQTSAFSSDGQDILRSTLEFSYLSNIVIRLFDDVSKPIKNPNKYRCEILFSPGATNDAVVDKSLSLAPYTVLSKKIYFDDLIRCLDLTARDTPNFRERPPSVDAYAAIGKKVEVNVNDAVSTVDIATDVDSPSAPFIDKSLSSDHQLL